MAKKPLYAVPDPPPDSPAAPAVEPLVPDEPMSVYDAAVSGSRLDELIAIRAVLARAIDDEKTAPRDLAALTKRQIEVSRDISSLRAQLAEEAREADESSAVTDSQWTEEAI